MAYDYINFSCTLSTYGTPGLYATLTDCENAVSDDSVKPVLILNPLWSASKKASLPLLINKLGDGYKQIVFNGVDQINEEWSITSPVVDETDFNSLLNQLRALCLISFLWSPNNGVIDYAEFTCDEWQKIRVGVGQYQLTTTFKQTISANDIPPSPVMDGLLIYLSPSSYPGSGTTWNDIQENYDFQLVNGASFSNGAMVFDGINDYAQTVVNPGIPTGNQPISLEVYVSLADYEYPFVTSKTNISSNTLCTAINANQIGFTSNGDGGNVNYLSDSLANPLNTYLHILTTYDGDKLKSYRNSRLVYTSSGGKNLGSNTARLRLMCFDPENAPFLWPVAGKLKIFRLYTKALSDAEVLRNYKSIIS